MSTVLNLDQPCVLVLNASYEALQVCSIKRAVTLLQYGIAEVLESTESVIRSPSTVWPVPSVVRLKRYIRRPRVQPVPFSRGNVLRRDGYACQYCGKKTDLTLDHVVPRSRGGPHTWENVVTACRSCNQRKGNRSPEEAGLTLGISPRAPSFLMYIYGYQAENRPEWDKYLYV
ncbi:MAG: HNH endonuclease [Deinococcaceae bacterium]